MNLVKKRLKIKKERGLQKENGTDDSMKRYFLEQKERKTTLKENGKLHRVYLKDISYNNVKSLIKYHTESTVILRINYDKKTIYGLKDILSNFDFVDKNRIIFDFQKVWQVDLSDTDKELLANGIDLFVKQGFNILTPEYRPNKWTSCYANRNNYKVFNYNGEIFKCTARDYSNDIKIGHVLDNVGSKSNTIYETYKLLNLSDFKECLACNILPICNGPCIQKMFEFKASEDIKFIDICLLSRYKSKDDYLKKHIKLLKK